LYDSTDRELISDGRFTKVVIILNVVEPQELNIASYLIYTYINKPITTPIQQIPNPIAKRSEIKANLPLPEADLPLAVAACTAPLVPCTDADVVPALVPDTLALPLETVPVPAVAAPTATVLDPSTTTNEDPALEPRLRVWLASVATPLLPSVAVDAPSTSSVWLLPGSCSTVIVAPFAVKVPSVVGEAGMMTEPPASKPEGARERETPLMVAALPPSDNEEPSTSTTLGSLGSAEAVRVYPDIVRIVLTLPRTLPAVDSGAEIAMVLVGCPLMPPTRIAPLVTYTGDERALSWSQSLTAYDDVARVRRIDGDGLAAYGCDGAWIA